MKITAVQKSQEITALLGVPNSRIIAGGTTFRSREDESAHGVDISGLEGLDRVSQKGNRIEIGPLTTLEAMGSSFLLKSLSPALAEAAGSAGDELLRSKGTLGGNLAGLPIGDLALPLLAANAMVTIKTDCDYREINLDRFYKTNGGNDLGYDEWLTRVTFAAPKSQHFGAAFARAGQWNESVCPIAAAVQMERDTAGKVIQIRGGIRPQRNQALRMFPLEKVLKNQIPDRSLLEKAAAAEVRALKTGADSELVIKELLLDVLQRALEMSEIREDE